MSLEEDRHQKSRQLELPLGARGETSREEWSGESSTAARGNERSGSDRLMEQVVEKDNAKAALKRVKQNRGSPGSDGMAVEELAPHLVANWLTIKQQLLDGTYQPQPVLRKEIPVYLSGSGRETTAEEEVEIYVRGVETTGAKAVKFKIGGRMSDNFDAYPGRTDKILELAAKKLASKVTLMADANGSYDAKNAIEIGKRLQQMKYLKMPSY